MGVENIGNTGGVQPKSLEQYDRSRGTRANPEDGRVAGDSSQTEARPEARPDRVEISENARKVADLRRTLEESRMAYDAVPDIRDDRVEEVRSRLASGYYDSVQVRDTVAARLGAVVRKMDDILG